MSEFGTEQWRDVWEAYYSRIAKPEVWESELKRTFPTVKNNDIIKAIRHMSHNKDFPDRPQLTDLRRALYQISSTPQPTETAKQGCAACELNPGWVDHYPHGYVDHLSYCCAVPCACTEGAKVRVLAKYQPNQIDQARAAVKFLLELRKVQDKEIEEKFGASSRAVFAKIKEAQAPVMVWNEALQDYVEEKGGAK